MKTVSTFLLSLSFLLALYSFAAADVAPDPGFKRISINLVVEAADDLEEYRFFMRSGADLKEIFLKKGERVTIGPLGGGAYYSAGTLLAVSKADIAKLDNPNEMHSAIYDGKVPGTLELIRHGFSREVRESEASSWQDPVYRIERGPRPGLKATLVSGGTSSPTSASSDPASGYWFWRSAAAAIVSGIFLLFGLAVAGIWLFRRRADAK